MLLPQALLEPVYKVIGSGVAVVVTLPAVWVDSGSSACPQTFLLLDTARVAAGVALDPSVGFIWLNKGLLYGRDAECLVVPNWAYW